MKSNTKKITSVVLILLLLISTTIIVNAASITVSPDRLTIKVDKYGLAEHKTVRVDCDDAWNVHLDDAYGNRVTGVGVTVTKRDATHFIITVQPKANRFTYFAHVTSGGSGPYIPITIKDY